VSDKRATRTSSTDVRARLISDLHAEDWEGGAPGDFARQAAACARGRVRRRRVAGVSGMLALAAAIWVGGVWLAGGADGARSPSSELRMARRAPMSEPPRSFPAALMPGRGQPFELSDDEALSLLRGRPLMIVPEADGGRRIILLDKPARRGTAGADVSPAL
jgi:hypothetical protein